ncbi:UNVERIFIED_CONTAM: hypothetical protein FKN15_011955 [Acipenser sinensis]
MGTSVHDVHGHGVYWHGCPRGMGVDEVHGHDARVCKAAHLRVSLLCSDTRKCATVPSGISALTDQIGRFMEVVMGQQSFMMSMLSASGAGAAPVPRLPVSTAEPEPEPELEPEAISDYEEDILSPGFW